MPRLKFLVFEGAIKKTGPQCAMRRSDRLRSRRADSVGLGIHVVSPVLRTREVEAHLATTSEKFERDLARRNLNANSPVKRRHHPLASIAMCRSPKHEQ